MKAILQIALMLLISHSELGHAQETVKPALDGVFDAFRTHQLVAIGERHGVAQDLDFYAAIVRDPRFAEVGHVVVEFGGAARQDLIDRYVAGGDVPYTQLRRVWTDTVGWIPSVTAVGYANFFAQVREVNRGLPPGKQIRLWLGEPPIDWSKIRTREEWQALDRTRDSYVAGVVKRNILATGRRALIIYGSGHFADAIPSPASDKLEAAGWRPNTLKVLVERDYPRALFLVQPYYGSSVKACAARFEQVAAGWPVPAMAGPIRGTMLEEIMRQCSPVSLEGASFPTGITEEDKTMILKAWTPMLSRTGADALLFLGPAATLTLSPRLPETYLDDDYVAELKQHYRLQTGEEMPSPLVSDTPVSPRFLRR